MGVAPFSSITEQVTSHLRQELAKGRWLTTVPGRNSLSAELGVSHKTVESALQNLEAEGAPSVIAAA